MSAITSSAATQEGASDPARVAIKKIAEGLRLSVRQAERRAAKDNWPFDEEVMPQGGKRRLYHAARLPKEVRDALFAHYAEEVPLPKPATSLPLPASLADWQRRSLEARLALLAEVDRLSVAGTWRKAAVLVERKAKAGTLAPALLRLVPVANARSGGGEGERTVALRTLYRWADLREQAVAADNWSILAPREPARAKPARPWEVALLSLYRQPQQRGIAWCLDEGWKRFPGIGKPSYDQAKRFIAALPPVERERGRRGPNALLALKGFKRRDTSGLEPLDVAVADGHTFKAEVAHPIHGRPFGPEVMSVQDRATRYIFGLSAGLAESTWVVMDGLRNGVSNLGLIGILYTDNGSGFVNDATSDELTGFYARLGMTHEKATAQRAQARGGIERSHRSVWVRAARALPTYRGKDMDREARKKVVQRVEKDIRETGASPLLMPWTDFLRFCQETVDAHNNRPHSALPKTRDAASGKLRHMTPAECLQSWRDKGWEPLTLAPAELDDLFRPCEERQIHRGEVRLPWGRYYDGALVPFHGQTLRVGYDIHDGSKVWVRDQNGRLICVARRDANVVPDMPESKVQHSRDQRAKRRARIAHDRLHEIELERRGERLLLDPAPAETITLEQQAAADAILAKLEPSNPATPVIQVDGARPRFDDDLSLARWLAAHPGRATANDRAYLADLLRRNSFRALLESEDVDIAALLSLVRTPPRDTTPDNGETIHA